VIFVIGPTSSGKSMVAAKLAERLGGEIISCDSMQIYRDMDVITQVPDRKILSEIPHHLIKVIRPEEEFSVAKYVKEATGIIDFIISKKKVPVIAGGTGLYYKSLIDGIILSPPKDEELRKSLNEIAGEKGNEYLYRELKKCDPRTAARLHPNDRRRIIRALEVYRLTGHTIHEKKLQSKGLSKKYACKVFGLRLPREILYRRINATVDKMFEDGIVDEVKRLKGRKLSLTAEKALGIKEVTSFLGGKTTLKNTKEELKKNTRRYAKRQMTWFRADKRIKWIDAEKNTEDIIKGILEE